MATWATVEDVAAEWDTAISTDQYDYIDRKLTSAELVLRAVADPAALVANGRTTPEAVTLVLVTMVLRVLRNPGGVRTQTAGPFSYTHDAQVASGRLFVSREDRRLLGLRSSANTITLDDPALPAVLRPPDHHWSTPAVPGVFVAAVLAATAGLLA